MIPTALISTRHEYSALARVYAPIAIGVFALIVLLVLWAVLRYRRRAEAATWHEHNPIEAGYAVLLTLVAAFLLYLTFFREHRVDTVANRQVPSLTIDVVAARWEWQFSYPRYGIVQRSGDVGRQPLVVPTNEPIRFELTSRDVIHAFWIPELKFKRDAFAGTVQRIVLTFTRAGTFPAACAEFCGLRHSDMVFTFHAVSRSSFEAWARSRGTAAP